MRYGRVLFYVLYFSLYPFHLLQAAEELHLTRPLKFNSLLGAKESYNDAARQSAKIGSDLHAEYYFYKGTETSEKTISINLGINITTQGTKSGYVGCSAIILDAEAVTLGAMSLSSNLKAGGQPARMYMHTGAVPPDKLEKISKYTLDCYFWQ